MEPSTPFREQHLSSIPIRDLGLKIAGTRLEPVLAEFERELHLVGITRLKPKFYLSTEWGVPDGTVAVAIPFYLARPDLTALHAERHGHVEGFSRADILRYLRHEMGHVVNYAYKLYETEEWVRLFGPMDRPYVEEYTPQPFSRRSVWHLPGWYAQKHPDEDWAETFAVWMTPGLKWQAEYAGWTEALAKLEYCDRTMRSLRDREPLVTAVVLEEDIGGLAQSLDEFYGGGAGPGEAALPERLAGALRTIFEEQGQPEDETPRVARCPASGLIRLHERELMAEVYRWTGLFPERTRVLLRLLAERADQLGQVYAEGREPQVMVALTAFVTALAMNRVRGGAYVP
jgi:hypothetical protein